MQLYTVLFNVQLCMPCPVSARMCIPGQKCLRPAHSAGWQRQLLLIFVFPPPTSATLTSQCNACEIHFAQTFRISQLLFDNILPWHFPVSWCDKLTLQFVMISRTSLDALASLGTMCVQGVFRVCSGCVQGVFRVCSECSESVFTVCSECVQSVFNSEVISSPSASSVSIFGIFFTFMKLLTSPASMNEYNQWRICHQTCFW